MAPIGSDSHGRLGRYGFGKAEKANRSLDIDVDHFKTALVQNKVRAKNQSPPTKSNQRRRTSA